MQRQIEEDFTDDNNMVMQRQIEEDFIDDNNTIMQQPTSQIYGQNSQLVQPQPQYQLPYQVSYQVPYPYPYSSYQNDSTMNFAGIKITPAAYLLLIISIILVIVVVFTIPFPKGIIVGLILLFGLLLTVYSVNCYQVGHCKVLAWIVSIIYVVYLAYITMVLLFGKGKQSKIITRKLLSK